MKICLIAVEIFAWGKHGGFGKATRLIGRELVQRGHEVFAVVPRRQGQRPVERLDGITVFGFSPNRPWTATALLRQCDADVYHSCEPSLATALALRAMPHKRHMVTLRDPRTLWDWWLEFLRPSLHRGQVLHNFLYENNWWVHRAIRRADAVCATARGLIPKVRAMYRLDRDPMFLPTPVAVPQPPTKAARPTVCYMARLDRRKRPELFLDLARRFPHVRFIIAGKSRDARWEARLRARYAGLPNLEFAGFVDQFSDPRHAAILSESWVMINTATREALPNAFLEAMAHGCALLSHVDPDGFATRFGFHAARDNFAEGLGWLLEDSRWRLRGQQAAAHIRDTFALPQAITLHERAYADLMGRSPGGAAGQPRITAVVLNHNKKADALACLASVARSARRLDDVVVVDNASTDGSAEAVASAFPQAHLIRNAVNLGAAGGRNAGWRAAVAHGAPDYLLFLDDDAVIEPAALGRLAEALQQDPRAGLACGKAYTRFPSRTIMSAGIIVNRWTGAVYDRGAGRADDGRCDRPGYVAACGGFAWLVRREALEALGGLDERFSPYGWEDVDFCLRAAAHGWRTRYVPEAIVYHGGGKIGRKPVPAYERRKVRNYFLLLRRHTMLLQKLSCLVCVPVRALLVVGRLIRQGHAPIVVEHWRGLRDGLRAAIRPSSDTKGGLS